MTDSPRPDSPSSDPSDAYRDPYQLYSDPAYAGSAPIGPSYSAASMPNPAPTEPLPQYWTQTTYPQPGHAPPTVDAPPEPPRGPRPWLWAAAGFSVAVVIGLVVWLVFINTNPSRQETSIPAMPQTGTTTTITRTPTTRPPTVPVPPPTLTLPPSAPGTTGSGETQSVSYDVTGPGRAITISYSDTGGIMGLEYNVSLPWHKDVDLPKPAAESASIIVTNAGRDITCSISIDGVKVIEHTGALLTVCGPSA